MRKQNKLDSDEKDLLESFERGEWKSRNNIQKEIKRYQTYARTQLKKDKRINIVLNIVTIQQSSGKTAFLQISPEGHQRHLYHFSLP